MVHTEYHRFLQTLSKDEIPKDVRKMANLVLLHLDTLIPLSTSQGQRVKKLVELAQSNWDSISSDIQPIQERTTEQNVQDIQLKSLTVGPFRGFAKQEVFDLASRLVFCYGPNGTGKSSFFEALEYGLLGYVAEAESKRFRNQNDYLENAHTNSFITPILTGGDNEGNDISVSADEAFYRFCFVEKTRIDSFSRIAAQPPAKQTELISSLFGLDAFTEFVRNFTETMDERYIDLEGTKAIELNQRKQALAGYQQQLKNSIPLELQKLDQDENLLAKEFKSECDFSQMVQELNGTKEKNGLITQLENELQKPVGTKSDQTLSDLQILQKSIDSNIRELNTKQQKLAEASQQVSFKQLYEVVIKVKENSPEKCPACHTPISQVSVNPFEHAEAELTKLQYLSELQEATDKLNKKINDSLTKLSQIINICCSYFPDNNPIKAYQPATDNTYTIDWWHSLHQQSAQITIQASQVLDDIHIGDSISTNGVCLTVSKHTPNSVTVDVMAETLRASNLSKLISGDKVNLERAVKAGDRFGGHMVSGHIDGTGRIQNISRESTAVWVTIAPSANLLRYIIKRGSIAIDGISLTVAFVDENSFSVSLVRHTATVTALLDKEIGSEVNIECDLVAKHIEKLISSGMEKHETAAIDMDYLRKHGFA